MIAGLIVKMVIVVEWPLSTMNESEQELLFTVAILISLSQEMLMIMWELQEPQKGDARLVVFLIC